MSSPPKPSYVDAARKAIRPTSTSRKPAAVGPRGPQSQGPPPSPSIGGSNVVRSAGARPPTAQSCPTTPTLATTPSRPAHGATRGGLPTPKSLPSTPTAVRRQSAVQHPITPSSQRGASKAVKQPTPGGNSASLGQGSVVRGPNSFMTAPTQASTKKPPVAPVTPPGTDASKAVKQPTPGGNSASLGQGSAVRGPNSFMTAPTQAPTKKPPVAPVTPPGTPLNKVTKPNTSTANKGTKPAAATVRKTQPIVAAPVNHAQRVPVATVSGGKTPALKPSEDSNKGHSRAISTPDDLSSESEVDHGATVDPTDPPYRASTQRNRVAPNPSIIRTRRARAAETQTQSSTNSQRDQVRSKTLKRVASDANMTETPNDEGEWSNDVQTFALAPAAPIRPTRKRQKRSRSTVVSDDEMGCDPASAHDSARMHGLDIPTQESESQEEQARSDGELHSQRAHSASPSDHYDYEGMDLDEYEASFIDDEADDIAQDHVSVGSSLEGEMREGEALEQHVQDAAREDGAQQDFDVEEDDMYVSDVQGDDDFHENDSVGTPHEDEVPGVYHRDLGDSPHDREEINEGDRDDFNHVGSLPCTVEVPDQLDSVPVDGEEMQSPTGTSQDVGKPNGVPPAPLTFGAVVGHKEADDGTFTRFQDDVEYTFFKGSLKVDESLVPTLQDPLLKQYYAAGKLEKYRKGVLITWSPQEVREGMVEFSAWGSRVPKLIFQSCLNAINFRRYGFYANLARVAPREMSVRNLNGGGQNFQLYTADKRVAICLSPVEIRSSFLYSPPKRGLRKKGVTGSMHTQEYERTIGDICTLFDEPQLHAQINQNAISFETRSEFGKDDDGSSKTASKRSNAAISPSVAVSSSARSKTSSNRQDTFSLAYDAEIPVYDGRERQVNFSEDLDHLANFPRWKGEIPFGSFAVVAYTLNKFWSSTQNGWAVGFNIQWVMVLGVRPQYDV